MVRKHTTALGLILILAGSALVNGQRSKGSSDDKAKRRAAIQNTRIIPGESIGLIRLGMGMDEVYALFGKPNLNYSYSQARGYSSTVWKYFPINLRVTFDGGAAPSVVIVTATAWSHANRMGDAYWKKNIEAPVVNYSTDNGVTLGSTSFAAVRAYAGNKYEDHTFWITFKELGLQLVISADHMVYEITVLAPQ